MSDKPIRKEVYLTFDDDDEQNSHSASSAPQKTSKEVAATGGSAPAQKTRKKQTTSTTSNKKKKREKNVVAKNVAFEPAKKTAPLPYEQDTPVGKGSASAFEQFIISVMLLILVVLGGVLALILTGRISLPF